MSPTVWDKIEPKFNAPAKTEHRRGFPPGQLERPAFGSLRQGRFAQKNPVSNWRRGSRVRRMLGPGLEPPHAYDLPVLELSTNGLVPVTSDSARLRGGILVPRVMLLPNLAGGSLFE